MHGVDGGMPSKPRGEGVRQVISASISHRANSLFGINWSPYFP